ncbi:MAG: magnesium/cobalt transporter CorA [Bacteroidales bacterium]|nr:magnesium/cobalt transporter CorA [Bacteroidales bacterium]
MINIFYKENGKISLHQGENGFEVIPKKAILWIDLLQPSYEERVKTEELCHITLQTKKEIEEIETSSRFIETDDSIINNSQFLTVIDNEFHKEPVSFVIKDNILVTYRQIELMTFAEAYRKVLYSTKISDAYTIFTLIYEIRIDLDADMIEGLIREIASLSKVENKDIVTEDALSLATKYQEYTMFIREVIIDKQRVLSYLLKSDLFPEMLHERVRTMLKDINSLIYYTDFCFQRLDYIQNNILGLINIEQNKIIKLFTVVTVILMPPTLIASIYGMNFEFMPELKWKWGYPLSLSLMVLSVVISLVLFKIKKWL